MLEFLASRTVLRNRQIPVSKEEWALREGFRLALVNAKTL